jgi:cobalt/nickel transport system permease protein
LLQARIERWSERNSPLHKRHAAAKILATLVLLICIATLVDGMSRIAMSCGLYFALLVTAAKAARIPVTVILLRAGAVLPFALIFALVSALGGDPGRALMLIVRGYLSSLAAILLIATTPMPAVIRGLEWLRAPRFLLLVMQFLYRYLVVLVNEANAMRLAQLTRAGSLRMLRFRHAGAVAGVLFARSFARAQAIHRAMVARGFEGRLPAFGQQEFSLSDAGCLAATAALIIGVRVAF